MAADVSGAFPKRNSTSSAHIRCKKTASLRGTVARDWGMPRCLATFVPQCSPSLGHLRLRVSSPWAASYIRAVFRKPRNLAKFPD